jgi:hypothetical protein
MNTTTTKIAGEAMQITDEFKDWFEREWSSYQDKAISGGKIMSMTWALKGYRALLASQAAVAASKRGTDAQILFERQLTCEAINGAVSFGYQNTNPPPDDDHWLAPYWSIGRRMEELDSALRGILNVSTEERSDPAVWFRKVEAARAAIAAPAPSCGDAEQADEAVTLPIMRAAFRVVETEGDPDPDKQRFHLRFTFRSMRELDAACDEWRAFSNAARAKDQS